VAVMTGDVAAFEAPVQHMAVELGGGAGGFQAMSQRLVATGAVEGAEVEVWQAAFEQVRDVPANRMGIKQQGIAEFVAQSLQLVAQRVVVRRPDLLQIGRAFFLARRFAFLE
nr:hypothetical protein [Tanacetum cinerariifolium]